jgi:hypothetical protein
MMRLERRRLEKKTHVAGRRATFREGLVLGHPAKKRLLSDERVVYRSVHENG